MVNRKAAIEATQSKLAELESMSDEEFQRRNQGRGYVYLEHIGGTDLYKIGFTTDLDQRHSTLSTGNPHLVAVAHSAERDDPEAFEKQLHDTFREFNIQGEIIPGYEDVVVTAQEWFRFNDDTLVGRVKQEIQNHDASGE